MFRYNTETIFRQKFRYDTFRYNTVEVEPASINHPKELCWLIESQYSNNTTLLLCKSVQLEFHRI